MIKGKPQLSYGGGEVNAAKTIRQKAGSPAMPKGGANFASYMPLLDSGQTQMPISATPLPNGQYAFQAQRHPLPSSWNGAGSNMSLTTSQVRNQAMRQNETGNIPGGHRSLSNARSQGNAMARSMMGMSNLGGMPQLQTNTVKTSPRVSGRPVTGRGEIGMEDTRRQPSAQKSAAGRRAATQAEMPATGPPESLGIMRPGQSRLAALEADAYSNFAARYQPPGLYQSFVTQGFASRNARTVLSNQGYIETRHPNVQTQAQLLPSPPASRTSASRQKRQGQLPPDAYPKTSLVPTFYAMGENGLGSLAAKFESGDEGIAAIGYDSRGGTSYGKYQISSRSGAMNNFVSYLQEKAPDLANRLSAAGPANTGSRRGKMPSVWRDIAAENPQRFEQLQSEFIQTSHFEPAMQGIAQATGLSFDSMSKTMQEVLFSTAVQHGPAGAVRIVNRAMDGVGTHNRQKLEQNGQSTDLHAERKLIEEIYRLRSGQFASSTARMRGSVQNRLRTEMREALNMLS